jgi:putative membrane protein
LHDLHLSNAGQGDIRLIGCRDDEFAVTAALAGLTSVGDLPLDRRVHPAEVWLKVRTTVVVAAVVAAVASLLVGWWALLAFVAVAAVWWATHRHVRTSRWSLGSEVATARQVISSSTQQAVVRKTNVVRVSQSIFERRRGLGRVEVLTAAGSITIGMIPIDEAYAVRDVIIHGVETDRRAWM